MARSPGDFYHRYIAAIAPDCPRRGLAIAQVFSHSKKKSGLQASELAY
ncbi:hypothetical protein IQ238_25160 [Pleurocapsales cyanobacterium LEGE 06147]|nr:hypothetical protein [Pleurocapsales cyanobacterium LEGE 06147]